LAYLKEVCRHHGLLDKIRLNSELISAVFDEQMGLWQLLTLEGHTFSTRHLIAASGPLNRPWFPAIAGIDLFRGQQFHSSQWDSTFNAEKKE